MVTGWGCWSVTGGTLYARVSIRQCTNRANQHKQKSTYARGPKWHQTDREVISCHYHSKMLVVLAIPWRKVFKKKNLRLTLIEVLNVKVHVFILLLFALLPDCTQNQTAVSDTLLTVFDKPYTKPMHHGIARTLGARHHFGILMQPAFRIGAIHT